MNSAPVSVIVVSRDRAAALRRCLLALTQQDHPNFEVIVVADPAGIAAASAFPVRLVPFDQANISAARNAGLALAAGEVVSFIDDDATAEPTWLSRLVAPFADETVQAATGFVRGRNGISRQWGAAWVDRFGADQPFDLPDTGGVFDATPDRAIKSQGTNCAFRRLPALAAGGFDPVYRFYHDETDLNLRMRARTAVVPLAQVVHGFAQSAQRRADRVPKSLVEIGASCAVFLRRHAAEEDLETDLRAHLAMQSIRLERHRAAGRISAKDVADLLAGFETGWRAGEMRDLTPPPPISPATAGFIPLPGTGPRRGTLIGARRWAGAKGRAKAKAAVQAGQITTLVCLSLTPRAHWLTFTEDGYWLQQGGIFGWSDRKGPRFRLSTFARRLAEARILWVGQRPLD